MVRRLAIFSFQFVRASNTLGSPTHFPTLMHALRAILTALLVGFVLAGCASTRMADGPADPNDPFEGFNRVMFRGTVAVDKAIFRPTALVYRKVIPQPIRDSVRNFLNNL